MSKQYDNTDRGALFKNERKTQDNQPDYTGSINVGGAEFYLSAWIRTQQSGRKYMSLAVSAKDERKGRKARGEDEEIHF